MVERAEETAGLSEVTKLALTVFGGEVVPLWKIKDNPKWKGVGGEPSGNNQHSEQHKARVKDAKLEEWWRSHAKKLLADHRSKKNELETAEVATRLSDPKLNEELKVRIKRL